MLAGLGRADARKEPGWAFFILCGRCERGNRTMARTHTLATLQTHGRGGSLRMECSFRLHAATMPPMVLLCCCRQQRTKDKRKRASALCRGCALALVGQRSVWWALWWKERQNGKGGALATQDETSWLALAGLGCVVVRGRLPNYVKAAENGKGNHQNPLAAGFLGFIFILIRQPGKVGGRRLGKAQRRQRARSARYDGNPQPNCSQLA